MARKTKQSKTSEVRVPSAVHVERVCRYEALLNEADEALSVYEAALDRFAEVQEKIAELDAYYGSKEWREDFEASETGKLPVDLPCGVLSEDGVWNLLERNRELIEETKTRFVMPETAKDKTE